MNHHTTEIVKDTKAIMREYLQRQIDFHREIMEKYQSCLQAFDVVPDPTAEI